LSSERYVKIIKDGRNQAVLIPREFEFPGDDVIMRKEGDKLILEPARKKSLLAILDHLEPLEEDFGPIVDQVPGPVGL
jgi:antitoxin VapB